MTAEKTTRQVTFQFNGQTCQGYEIHQGVSDTDQAILQTNHCIGTYIHGFLDNAPVIEHLLKASPRPLQIEGELARAPFSPPSGGAGGGSTFKDQQYDKLAAHVRQHVDMDKLYQIISDHD
jgi:adenosylcobyric acid synthase